MSKTEKQTAMQLTSAEAVGIACYDNGGETMDRYTVVYLDDRQPMNCYGCVGMSENPFSPQGFGQHSVAMIGGHLGNRINFYDMPEACQRLVLQDLRA